MNSILPVLFVFASQIVGSEFDYTVRRGDSLISIGARFGVSVNVLAGATGMDPQKLRAGDVLKIDNRHITPPVEGKKVVVNVPQRMLFWTTAEGEVQAFPIAAGRRSWQTPTGDFTVETLETDPIWDVPISIREEMRRQGTRVVTQVPPGPNNPLGKYWIGLSIPGVGIHGTNVPSSIYSLVTHGCIRLHPGDIEQLFPQIETGMPGRITYEPVLIARIGNSVFVEVHPDPYGKALDPMAWIIERARQEGYLDMLAPDLLREAIRKRDGVARDVTRR